MIDHNVILRTDAYKYSHRVQYPQQKGFISEYIESRGGKYPTTVMAGIQYYVQNLQDNPVTKERIDEAEDVVRSMGLDFERDLWDSLVNKYGGHLPIRIEAVPEGTKVPFSNLLVQVVNTDRDYFWLPSFVETDIQRSIWYPTTVASRSRHVKDVIRRNLETTADNLDGLNFKLHDFGA